MKKSVVVLCAVLVLFAVIGCHHVNDQPINDGTGIYPDTLKVVSLDYESDIVILETSTGYLYQWTGCEDYLAGDLVSVIMDRNGTPEIFDDIIVSMRYSGFYVND